MALRKEEVSRRCSLPPSSSFGQTPPSLTPEPTDEPEARTNATDDVDRQLLRANERGPDAKDFSRWGALLALFLKKDALTSPKAREEKW